ncbi:ABC transporter permease [Actinoplanes sp. CA-030573]|uniref:ABC transporter permease n=1 Tax=Actinoplanes sp. CA-030573 TaxID=3239898 RepID=UPI003D90D36A
MSAAGAARLRPGRRVRAAAAAEWVKMRTIPDVAVAFGLTVLLIVAVSAATAGADSPDRVHSALLGVQAGQAVVAVWAVQMLAGEFGTGTIRPAFVAVPRRHVVLGVKALLLLGGVLTAAVVSVTTCLLAFSAGASGGIRAAAGSVLYLGLIALLGLGVAAIMRSAVASAGVVLGLLYLVPVVMGMFADPGIERAIYRIGPSTAGLTVLSTVDLDSLPIGPWAGLGVAAAWAFGALAAGALIVGARDV